MVEIVLVALKLAVVRHVMPPDRTGVVLELQTGQRPLLRRTNRDFDYYLHLARDSFADKQPVAIGIRENEVQRMMLADLDTVRELVDDGHGNLKIWFLAHDGTYLLDSSSPDAKRIRALLSASREAQSPVWFAAGIPRLTIQDVATPEQLGLK